MPVFSATSARLTESASLEGNNKSDIPPLKREERANLVELAVWVPPRTPGHDLARACDATQPARCCNV
jgi:hypothetical protein